MIRRSALDSVGGFAASTATEELHTSIKLHKRGYRSVYHARSLAFGLAPHRGRDVRAAAHARGPGRDAGVAARADPRVAAAHGAQKAELFRHLAGYFDGWAKAVLYLAPVVVLDDRACMPLAAVDRRFPAAFRPVLPARRSGCSRKSAAGIGRTLQVEQYGMARFAAFLWATFGPAAPACAPAVRRDPGGRRPQRRVEALSSSRSTSCSSPTRSRSRSGSSLARAPRRAARSARSVAASLWAAATAALAAIGRSDTSRRQTARSAGGVPRSRSRCPRASGSPASGPVLGIFDDVSSSGFRFHGAIPPAPRRRARRLEGDLFIASGRLPFRAHGPVRGPRPPSGGERHRLQLRVADDAERDRLDAHLYGSDLQVELNGFEEQRRPRSTWLAQTLHRRAAAGGAHRAAHWAPVLYHDATSRAPGPHVGVRLGAGQTRPRRARSSRCGRSIRAPSYALPDGDARRLASARRDAGAAAQRRHPGGAGLPVPVRGVIAPRGEPAARRGRRASLPATSPSRAPPRAAMRASALGGLVARHPRLERRARAATARRSRRGSARRPTASPARYAAPSAVVSVTRGRTTGTPRRSAWNCMSRSFAVAPPSTRSSASRTPASRCIARQHLGRSGTRSTRARRARGARAGRAAREADASCRARTRPSAARRGPANAGTR